MKPKESVLSTLEKFSTAMLAALSCLPVAGLLLALGALLASAGLGSFIPVLRWEPLVLLGNLVYNGMMAIVQNLGVLFCVGVAAFLARKDNQIKHAGYRIELGEVEAAVNSLPDIQAAVCLFDEGRDKIVCVYQGAAPGQTVAAALRELLPRYMLPNLYRPVAEMPYTANGKIDRVQLRRDYDGTNSIL